ncbi:MAG: DUF3015 family protein [Deltaproteobacteria bacterium]|nr:DUF3015 family protein [Deltaproteobacteria bacterium]MBW2219491.1 DUF3015 family protein [Deltaproteobacteria bacterium]
MKKILIAVLISLFLVGTVSANTVKEDCGCGLGRMALAEKEGLVWNLLGTFLNGLCGNQTFGMSSGTLECGKPEKLVMLEKMNIFVADNMDSLAVDIAQGDGESLDALAEIAEISAEKRLAFNVALQGNFDYIYQNQNVKHEEVTNKITEIIHSI